MKSIFVIMPLGLGYCVNLIDSPGVKPLRIPCLEVWISIFANIAAVLWHFICPPVRKLSLA